MHNEAMMVAGLAMIALLLVRDLAPQLVDGVWPAEPDKKPESKPWEALLMFKKGGGSAPKPDPNIGVAAVKEAELGEEWLKFAQEQFGVANKRQDGLDKLSEKVTNQQLQGHEQAMNWAQEDRKTSNDLRDKYLGYADQDRATGQEYRRNLDQMGQGIINSSKDFGSKIEQIGNGVLADNANYANQIQAIGQQAQAAGQQAAAKYGNLSNQAQQNAANAANSFHQLQAQAGKTAEQTANQMQAFGASAMQDARQSAAAMNSIGSSGMAAGAKYADKFDKQADEQFAFGKNQLSRYTNTFQPIEQQIASEAKNWDSADRQNEMAAQAKGDVLTNAAAQREASQRQQASMGVNPNSGRAAASSNSDNIKTALAAATAQNQARDQVRQQAVQMRQNAAALGQNVASMGQQANSMGMQATSAGNSALNQGLSIGMQAGSAANSMLNQGTQIGMQASSAANQAKNQGTQLQGQYAGAAADALNQGTNIALQSTGAQQQAINSGIGMNMQGAQAAAGLKNQGAGMAMQGIQGNQNAQLQGNSQAMQATNLGLAASGLGSTSAGLGMNNQAAGYGGLGMGINASGNALSSALANNASWANNSNIIGSGYQGAMSGYGNQANILNAQYANQLSAWNAKQQADAAGFGGLMGGVGTMVGGIWSSKKLKEDKKPIPDGALDAMNSMPVQSWKYKDGVADGGYHIGPYAEDFQKATGKGDGTSIPIVDAIGVTMKAVQELDQKVEKLGRGLAR